MTDLLARPTRKRDQSTASSESPERWRPRWTGRSSTASGYVLAGLAAASSGLAVCMVVALAGWFASDGGSHGTTRDALRVGADAWLIGHGARLELAEATITVVPLGVTLLCWHLTFRLSRRAARSAPVDDPRSLVTALVCLSGTYGVVAVVAAVLASAPGAHASPGRACVGGLAVALTAGGCGLIRGSDLWPRFRDTVPESARAVMLASSCAVLLLLAAGSALLAGSLLWHFGTAANVLSRSHVDVPGGLLYAVVVAAVSPNAAVFAASYLVGPGFAVGSATLVSPTVVTTGALPAFPLLAALPDEGPGPPWAMALLAAPVLAAVVASALTTRRFPMCSYPTSALRGLLTGVAAGVAVGLAGALAGGAVGPGRMAVTGPDPVPLAATAALAMVGGALLGGLGMTWWRQRGSHSDSLA